ncbi:MAG: nucleotidyltransferase substrate binding protein [Candidatus Omnitrophota bacterium]
MTPARIKELLNDFEKALQRLNEALNEDISKGSVIVDGTIQRFEFTFELAWKLAKNILAFQGIEANSPRSAIKEAFRSKLITDGNGWIDMLEDRGKTSHIYDEKNALEIYEKIKKKHYPLLKAFRDASGSAIG